MARVLGALGSEKALVVHGSDGMDELTITGPSTVWLLEGGDVSTFQVSPDELGLTVSDAASIRAESPEDSAAVARSVLSGEPGAARDVVLMNASAALVAAGRSDDLATGVQLAAQSIDTGAAQSRLTSLAELTQTLD